MTKSDNENAAFGQPGIHPRWTHGGKDGVGTAYAASSQIWFTLWNGIITEVYYPTVDRPQLRDLQYLITDGKSFFHEEKRHLKSKFERLSDHTLGYRCTNSDPEGRYAVVKEIITDPHLACVLQRTKLTGDESFISKLRAVRAMRSSPGSRRMGEQRLCRRTERPQDSYGTETRNMAGAGRYGALFSCFMRLCRSQRRLDRSSWQLSNGLAVRPRD